MNTLFSSRYTGQEVEGLLNKASRSATQDDLQTLNNDVDSKIQTLNNDVDSKIQTLNNDVDSKIQTLNNDVDSKIQTLNNDVDSKIQTLNNDVDSKIQAVKSGTQIYKLDLKLLYGTSNNPNGLTRLYTTLYTANKLDFTKRSSFTTPNDDWSTNFINSFKDLIILGYGTTRLMTLSGDEEIPLDTLYISTPISFNQSRSSRDEYTTPLGLNYTGTPEYVSDYTKANVSVRYLYRPYCVDYTYTEV